MGKYFLILVLVAVAALADQSPGKSVKETKKPVEAKPITSPAHKVEEVVDPQVETVKVGGKLKVEAEQAMPTLEKVNDEPKVGSVTGQDKSNAEAAHSNKPSVEETEISIPVELVTAAQVQKDEPSEESVEVTSTKIQEISARFLTISTSTLTSYLTTTSVCSTSTTCGSFAASVTQCRRRRGIEEKPLIRDDAADEIGATEPLKVETTASPAAEEPTIEAHELASSEDEDLVAKVKRFNWNQGRKFPTVTIIYTTSVTGQGTCLSTSTKTTTIAFTGCYPVGISKC